MKLRFKDKRDGGDYERVFLPSRRREPLEIPRESKKKSHSLKSLWKQFARDVFSEHKKTPFFPTENIIGTVLNLFKSAAARMFELGGKKMPNKREANKIVCVWTFAHYFSFVFGDRVRPCLVVLLNRPLLRAVHTYRSQPV